MARLSADQIAQELSQLAGWQYKDNAIRKLFRFKSFTEGIAFVNRVAELAEAADHHPNIQINYSRVTFICTTHSEGAVTEKDLQLARQIESAYAAAAR